MHWDSRRQHGVVGWLELIERDAFVVVLVLGQQQFRRPEDVILGEDAFVVHVEGREDQVVRLAAAVVLAEGQGRPDNPLEGFRELGGGHRFRGLLGRQRAARWAAPGRVQRRPLELRAA